MTELLPGILNQLGPDALNGLKKLADSYAAKGGVGAADDVPDLADDDVPDLVEETA